MSYGFFVLTPAQLREAVYILAQRTGWSLTELISLEEQELMLWIETSYQLQQRDAEY